MFWINVDKAIPAYDEQLVKVKVADFTKDYITEGWYDHNKQEWYSVDGFCLHDNVYAWRHMRPAKTINWFERKERIERWQ